MGKGGSTQTSQVQLPKVLEDAARENLALAEDVGSLGFTPNMGPTVAGLSPMQRASMQNTNQAASAFGMQPSGSMDDYFMGESFNGGAAYGAAPLYEQMLAGISPEQRAAIESFVGGAGRRPQQAPSAAPRGPLDFFTQGGSSAPAGGFGEFDFETGRYNTQSGGGFNYQNEYDAQMDRLNGGSGISVGYGNNASQASSNARSSGGRK